MKNAFKYKFLVTKRLAFAKSVTLVLSTIVALTGAALITSCSKGDSASGQNTLKIAQDRASLKNTYSVVNGKYQGTVQSSPASFDIALFIKTIDTNSGRVDDKGAPIMQPVLKAVLRRLDNNQEYNLDGQFFPETGEVSFSNSNAKNEDLIQLNGPVSGTTINATLSETRGTIGTVTLSLVDKNPTIPSSGLDNDHADRLRSQYKAIEGIYNCAIQTNEADEAPYTIQLRVFVVEAPLPKLMAFGKRLDDITRNQEYVFNVNYQPENSPALISFYTDDNVTNALKLNLKGYVSETKLLLTVVNYRGYVGTCRANKIVPTTLE